MASITWNTVVAFAPGLSSIPVDAQNAILDHVNGSLNVAVLGGEDSPRVKLMRIYLAAHMGTLNQRGAGGAGPVIGESVGGVSRQYANLTTNTLLASTTFGQEYMALLNTSGARLPVVV